MGIDDVSDAAARAFQRARLKKEQKKAVDGLLAAGLDAYKARRYTEAQFLCGQILVLLPDHFDALNFLGVIQMDAGHAEDAEATLRRALVVDPRSAEAHCNHGVALFELKRYDEARAAYERALALKPKYPTALTNLGNAYKHLKKLDKALGYYDKASALDPRYVDAWINRGSVQLLANRHEDAERCYKEALRLQPRSLEPLCGLAQLDTKFRRFASARSRLDTVLAARPDMPEALVYRGRMFMAIDDIASALRDFDAALALAPSSNSALVARAELARALKDTARAAALTQQVLQDEPNDATALTILGGCLVTWGDIPGAIARYDQALAAEPYFEGAISHKIFALDFATGAGFAAQQAVRRQWWERIGSQIRRATLGDIDVDPERRLRVGYISSDFRQHSAGLAVLPVFHAHDHGPFEITAYHCSVGNDAVTAEFRGLVDNWVDASGMSDDDLADRVVADRIDILVDLSGHTAGHRLGIFSRKCAPVQVTAWGHATGTGIPLIDYIFSDPVAIPMDARPLFAETVVDLPCAITMTPTGLPVSPLPMLRNGHVTFGVFNRVDKISDEAIALWSRIFAAVPDARLIVKHGMLQDAVISDALLKRLAAGGIAPDRVTCLGSTVRSEHLRAFDEVDISLDPFPQNGGVSTWESLFMGVPVVARLGDTIASRISAAILTAIGLPDFIAPDDENYIDIALRFAANPDALAELRAGLPERIAGTDVGDRVRYTRAVEACYRRFWRDYCAGRSSSTA